MPAVFDGKEEKSLNCIKGEVFQEDYNMEKAKAFISVGHYPRRPGAVNTKYGLIEHHEARKIVDAFFTEIITPQTICSYIPVSSLPLNEKVRFINAEANDSSMAIEIHFNAWEPNKAQGIETLYFPGSEKGKNLAGCLQKALLGFLPFADRGLKPGDNLHLLKATTIPTVIVEALFIDNDQEASYLFYPRSHLLIAKALFQGIEGYIEGNISRKRAEG